MLNKTSELLNNYPVIQISKEDAEADDMMYSLVKLLDGEETTIITTDSDMIQLCQKFKNANVWNPISKVNHKIPPYNYVIFKSVVGDTSDNINGLPRHGNAKGKKIAQLGISSLSDEYRKIVEENIKIIDLAMHPNEEKNSEFIKNIITDVKLDYNLEQIKKYFFDLKLKDQLDKFDTTTKIIKSLINI